MGKLIIIEGSDGSGKETQTNLLYKKLKERNFNIKKISFPNYESPASEPLKMYLSGEFGKDVNDVNSFAASTFFAVDRYASYKQDWEKFYNNSGIVLSDRYTTSNMVHQASKIENEEDKQIFLKWLIDLEWNKLGLPTPDIVIFLDVSPELSQKLMSDRKNKITGEEKKDIHETNSEYLKNSYYNALNLAKQYGWTIVSCETDGVLKNIEEINEDIIKKLSEKGVIYE